jgi:hypothetical protein
MPVFHLHIVTPSELIHDVEGFTLPDLDAARREAIRGARALLSAEVLDGELDLRQRIRIHDDAGRHLSTVRFEDVVRVTSAAGGQVGELAKD